MLAILLFQRMHTLWFCSNCCNCTLTVHLSAPSVGQKYHSVMQSDISIIRGHIVASLWPGKSVPGWSLAYKILTKRFRLLPFFFFFFREKNRHQNKLKTKINYLSDFSSMKLRFPDTIASTSQRSLTTKPWPWPSFLLAVWYVAVSHPRIPVQIPFSKDTPSIKTVFLATKQF